MPSPKWFKPRACRSNGSWRHVHADHRSAAGYLKKKLGGALGIGSNVRQVQQTLGNLFNDKPAIPPGAGFDHLFEDGETFRVGALDVKALYTPGHTPADMSYMLETLCSPGTRSSCRTMERRDAISLAAMPGRFIVQPRADPVEVSRPKAHLDRQDQHPGATGHFVRIVWRRR